MRSKVSLYEAHNTGCSASFYGAEHHIFASTPMANYSEEGWCRRCRGDEDRLALYALDAIHKTKRTISEHNFSKFRHFFFFFSKFYRCTTYQRFVDKTYFYEQIEQVAYWFA